MAKSLKSFPESERAKIALRRLESCTGLSKCGAVDYLTAMINAAKDKGEKK